MPNMKALAQILFEISCTQDFQILFSKGHNSEKGHNSDMKKNTGQLFLAHLSRRLIGELIVYPCSGVRPSVVRRPSSVRPSSTISKIFFSETAGPIVLILHLHHLQVGGKNNCVFCFDRIRTLVAMATYASHRLTMEKSENCQFLLSCWRYLNFVFAEMFIE